MNPRISVIIPVYNPGKHLIKCLESIVNQTYRNLQIILIDDGSTDGSAEACDKYAEADKRIICVHQKNRGVSAARNKGIEMALGDFYYFPDSDDYLELDAFEYLLDLMVEHNCDAVSFEFFATYSDHERENNLGESYYGLYDKKDAHRLVLTGTPFAWNKFFKKELVTATGNLSGIKFREDIYRGEDSLFVHETFERANKVWFDNRPLYHYVQSEESAVRGKFRASQLSAVKLYDAYKPLYREKYPELLGYHLVGMSHLMITLYYDMWSDEEDYSDKQKEIYEIFKKHQHETYEKGSISTKVNAKFKLFSVSPSLFCILHKVIHRL